MSRKQLNSTSNIKFLTNEEKIEFYHRVISDTSRYAARNLAIFNLAKYCALRASEIGLIKIGDYNPYKGTIYCRRLKGSISNTLKIVNPSVVQALNNYYFMRLEFYNGKKENVQNCLFISQKGVPLSRKMLDVLMKSYCKNTNIPQDKRHFHVLKHTRAIELIEYPNTKLTDVQWWLGHKSINSTMIYLSFTSQAMQQLFEYLTQEEGTIEADSNESTYQEVHYGNEQTKNNSYP